MRASTSDNWYYARNGERTGPVSLAKLKEMAAEGWLTPEDLIWRAGISEWMPAKDSEELFPNSLGRLLRRAIAGVQPAARSTAESANGQAPPPTPPATTARPKTAKPKRQARPARSEVDWNDVSPRHLVAAFGGFLAALGIAFTAIAQSNVPPRSR